MADLLLSPTSTAPSSVNLAAAAGSLEDRLSQLLNSNTQFSVAAYLNLALSSGSGSHGHLAATDAATESLQGRMAELALQLQLQTQSCHDDIGRIGAELQAILPRCAADVGRVGVGLEGMRLDAQALLEQTARGAEEQELSSSLETLTTLHALRSNLSQTKEVLTAAATWDSTMSSIPPLLAQQNLSEAVNALRQLENGERALRGMPNREERQLAIDKVRQQVQVLLQPQLKHALQNMNTRIAPLQQCVALYEKLDKMDALREEYVKTRPGALHKAWFDFSPSYSPEVSMDDSTTKSDLETWLPNWYDMVLQLLTEERRQSATVFGAEAAPEIVVKVLRECFRPILPSFQSRLETVFSSNPAMTSKGSFESICAVYESTLRFLSLAYELVAGAFLDLAEAGMAHKGDTGVGLYTEMIAVMATVSSPFANYQQRFDQLEGKHLQIGTSELAKSMQQTVSLIATGRTTAFDALQQAVDRLKDIAPCVFPSTESSLVRFELLSGGYRVGPALAMIDKILASHVGEVTIAVKTFSAALNSDHSPLLDGFDEQHVLCAMEVLKLAGNFRRDLRTFEDKTRDKLSLLSDRIANYILQENEVEKAASGKHGSVGSSFSLPDSLSVVEIDSILTKLVCGGGGDGKDAHDESAGTNNNADDVNPALELLNRLAVASKDDHGFLLYPEAEDAIQRLAQSCHGCVLDVCSAVPRKHLSTMSEMSSWKQGASSDAFDSYGTLPQPYITQVGEHMLALVQAFEPFAADQEALSIANEVMDGVKDVALQSWGEFAASAGILGSESTLALLMHGIEIGHLVLSNSALSEEDAELEEGISEAERASAIFCNAWLDVVGLAVTGRLLERVMRIPQLTQKGCEHLNADLNYLVNVFSALGVAGHPHPLVTHLAELAMLSDDDLRVHIMARHRDNSGEGALRSVEARMALLRGVSLN